ncbi:MAG TPA: SPOR domain-containing protein, partial [Candidatus Eisenbacteria bacterium]|nr:SPOR domain-containing protein [Candidatus Eisenbacteria bacterium]
DVLASGTTLPRNDRMEAEFLRAGLEESGTSYEERLRALLDRGLDRERQGLAHLALGQIAYVRGDYAVAIREFGHAREEGRSDEASLWEGLSALALGDVQAARTALGRAERSSNAGIRDRARIALGSAHEAAGDWAAARDAFQKIREDGPEGRWWSAAALAEAQALEQLGDAGRAGERYREILDIQPDGYEAPIALARLSAIPAESSSPEPSVAGARTGTYSVQLGAFADPDNAQAFARALEQRGIAPVRVAHAENGLHRVLVGSGLSRTRAESLGDSLGTALGVGFSLAPDAEDR